MLNTRLTRITEETRIRWLQTQTNAESLLVKIKELINSGIYRAEDTLSHLLNLLSGGWDDAKDRSADVYEKAKSKGPEKEAHFEKKASETGDWAKEKADDTKQTVGDKIKVGGQKLKGEL